jgi:acyl-CoA thioesterase I
MLRLLVLWIVVGELMCFMPDIQSMADDHKSDDLYLALGDSLAVGEGATNPKELGYVGRLDEFLELNLTNLAVRGETSSTFINRGKNLHTQLAAALSTITESDKKEVKLVTLDIGGDDLFNLLGGPCSDPASQYCKTAFAGALQTFASNYTFILQKLTDALGDDFPHERILVMTYYNPFNGTDSPFEKPVDQALLGTDLTIDCTANLTDSTKVGLNDLIACIGESFGVTVVDVYPLFKGQALVLTHILKGDIHPNNAGYAVIANAFEAVTISQK